MNHRFWIKVATCAWAASTCAIACARSSKPQPDAGSPPGSASASSSAEPSSSASSSASAAASGSAWPGRSDGCDEGMVRIQGNYCPAVKQTCAEHHKEYKHNPEVSERCLDYEQPSECLSKERKPMSFCMDRFEYPNKVGEIPINLVSWRQAVKLCESAGKRLCTEEEFNFACEGEQMLPYVYGYKRDAEKCNIDKPYRKREKKLRTYDKCPADPVCAAEMARLDQRLKIGESTSCVSPFGVFDLNGNVNEWVNLPGNKPPDRSGLKGGWWGPVRCRCRPTVTFHKEEDYGYEAGFRCCADAK